MRFNYEPPENFSKLIPAGDYSFEVISAEDAISKNGNEYIKLNLAITEESGKKHTLFAYLFNAWQVYNFCVGINEVELYENGELNPVKILGKKGKVRLDIKKDLAGKFPDQNKVVKYIRPSSEQEKVAPVKEFDDELPF